MRALAKLPRILKRRHRLRARSLDSVAIMDLERFITAQNSGGTYQRAVAELRRGRKTTHWMWFIFPQIAGLGRSAMAQAYAISDLAEAQAYLAHPILGPRLVECAEIVAKHRGLSAEQIFGGIDAMKLRSSMTLFSRADPDQEVFNQLLDQYFNGPDPETERRV
jgi:uncharacterized protein (DUF1810 family)